MKEEEIKKKIKKALRKDILERYDNPEYWNMEIAEEILREFQLTKKQRERILNSLF
ncbi:MAG: hypothetical protein QXR87_06835 [Candidatus Hadarchaeales archaeon]